MAINKKDAKKYSIIKWKYFYESGSPYLTDELIQSLGHLYSWCGMCEYYESCNDCYLSLIGTCTGRGDCAYDYWGISRTTKERKKYAKTILDVIRAW